MTELEALNQCLAWLTARVPLPEQVDGLVLCGNSLPATATAAGRLAVHYQLPVVIIAGGVGHATKYLRRALGIDNELSEAEIMATLVRSTGYQGAIRLDTASTNSGSNAVNARELAPVNWQHVLLVQDPLLARRTALTFEQNWDKHVRFTRYQPTTLQLTRLDPLQFTTVQPNTWPTAYFTELLLGECQRLHDTPTGYGPRGRGFIAHADVPACVVKAYQFLRTQPLNRER